MVHTCRDWHLTPLNTAETETGRAIRLFKCQSSLLTEFLTAEAEIGRILKGLLGSQPSLLSEFQTQERPCLQKSRWTQSEEEQPRLSSEVHTHAHRLLIHLMHTWTYTYTYIKRVCSFVTPCTLQNDSLRFLLMYVFICLHGVLVPRDSTVTTLLQYTVIISWRVTRYNPKVFLIIIPLFLSPCILQSDQTYAQWKSLGISYIFQCFFRNQLFNFQILLYTCL